MFTVYGLLSQLVQLLHVVPPAVGLVLVGRMRTPRRWRTWALLSFGLALVAAVASTGFTLFLVSGLYGSYGWYAATGVFQGALTLVSLAASGLGVAAVVSDRAADTPAAPGPPGIPRGSLAATVLTARSPAHPASVACGRIGP